MFEILEYLPYINDAFINGAHMVVSFISYKCSLRIFSLKCYFFFIIFYYSIFG